MTAEQYLAHPTLKRAFLRGMGSALAGQSFAINPYRKVSVIRRARRNSWTEGFTRAWAEGYRYQLQLADAGAAPRPTVRAT